MPDPDPSDGVLDNVVEVPTGSPDTENDEMGDTSTAEVPAAIQQQNLGRLAGAGVQAHEHFVTFNKILDLSYEQDRKMVSLTEALGVREVTSESGQAGIPRAARPG